MELQDDAFKSRDKVLCAMLFVFGMINFCCTVRADDLDDAEKLWASATFITLIGALLTLILQGIEWENNYALYGVIFLLFCACVLTLASGAKWAKDYCGDNEDYKHQCELYVFGVVVLPALIIVAVAMDLFSAKFMKKRRIRLCIFTVIVFTTSILLSVHYYEKKHLDSDDKSTEAAFTVLMGISAFTFLAHGIFGLKTFVWLNIFVAFVFCAAVFLLLVDDLACVSIALVWWFLLCAVVHLILADIQDGGIIGVYRHVQPKSYAAPKQNAIEKSEKNPLVESKSITKEKEVNKKSDTNPFSDDHEKAYD